MKIQDSDIYKQIASGNRLTSASKDPAGTAISEKLTSQIKGSDQAIDNIASSQNLLQTADGALNGISEDLQRVRELAVQASSGIMTDSDKSIIQGEIDEIFKQINTSAQNTEFNTMKLLDGSFENKTLGANNQGQGTIMNLENSSLQGLGLEGFSVEGDFDIGTIDQALSKVQESRSEIGAKSNGFESQIRQTEISRDNLEAGRSTIADMDIAKAVMDLNKEKVLNQYQMAIQNKQVEQEKNQLGLLI